MKHKIMLALSLLLISLSLHAQSKSPWTQIQEKDVRITGERLTIPKKYLSYHLDAKKLTSILQRTPQENFDSKVSESILTLPVPDGTMQDFYIFESSVMHPNLAKKYPEIKSYLGYGVKNSTYYLRFDVTPLGFHAMVLGPDNTVQLIDPMAKGNTEYYISYNKKDCAPKGDFTCAELDKKDIKDFIAEQDGIPSECGVLRVYDLALAASGQYTMYFGSVAATLASLNTLVTRVNGIYERDVRVRLQLVANNDLIIFTDPATDPYAEDAYNDTLDITPLVFDNQVACDNYIGSDHYDIGHLVDKFILNTGGALPYTTCEISYNAWGASRHIDPIGDPFVVDYVSHEIGHQFGARHTQNTISNCREYYPTAFEPGSGSTIMAYSGVCAPNVQIATDDYFHGASVLAINNYTISVGCEDILTTSNFAPDVEAGPDRTFPKNTPFVLTAVGSDPNDSALTYCWEQMDNEQLTTTPPANTETGGPVFRSFQPITSPRRWFPRLPDVVANINPDWEVLPNVARNLNFNVTVRDNFAGGGCTAQDAMLITVDGNSGPFLVTYPNTPNLTMCGGGNITVTWDVANTNAAPVSCPRVDIVLSPDGGLNFPFLLQSSAPNTGSATVTLPALNSTQCRIMVRAHFVDGLPNLFYDISNANFAICNLAVPATPPPALQYICYGHSNCYIFPSSLCHTGFIVQSLDPKVQVHVFGMQVCLTNLAAGKRIAKVNITPTGPCGNGPTQQWTIYVDWPGHCTGFEASNADRDQISMEAKESIQVLINQKPYLFEGITLDGSTASNPVNIEVYDVQGKLLLSNAYDTRIIDLDTSSFPAGVLILNINYQGKQITDKILNFKN